MKTYISLLVISISLLAFSCNSTKRITNLDQDEVRFSLEKGVCFGNCPTYRLTINQGGYATLEGFANINKLGVHGKQLSKEQFEILEDEFMKSNFETFPLEYKSQIPDLPSNAIGYHNGTAYKIVTGKEDRPEELMQLQFLLEKIVDSGGWKILQSPKEVNQSKKPEVVEIFDEVIIEPIPGTQIAKWLESMDKYGVRLKKKIAPTLNLYLITYDSKLISSDEFLNTLKRDENIKTAEFNKKTQRRRG